MPPALGSGDISDQPIADRGSEDEVTGDDVETFEASDGAEVSEEDTDPAAGDAVDDSDDWQTPEEGVGTPGAASSALRALPRSAFGIAQNNSSLFGTPGFEAMHIKHLRVGVCWNVALDTEGLARLTAILAPAKQRNMKVTISFEKRTWLEEPVPCRRTPSRSEYRTAVKRFLAGPHADYPDTIEAYTAWNEPNHRDFRVSPTTAARYYATLRSALRTSCVPGRCTLLAGDLTTGTIVSYLKTYNKALEKMKVPAPRRWAFHPYDDIWETGQKYTKRFMSQTKGTVWFTEAGARCGERMCTPGNDVDNIEQRRQTEYLVEKLAVSDPRIRRVFYYQYNGGAKDWDTGLATSGPSGNELRRTAYREYCKVTPGGCAERRTTSTMSTASS
ncbi:MAG: hypothetical protein LC808_04590 [Actinobacteria bacterium]|nr:hypothetical protein [Actinomycetota bacterium]